MEGAIPSRRSAVTARPALATAATGILAATLGGRCAAPETSHDEPMQAAMASAARASVRPSTSTVATSSARGSTLMRELRHHRERAPGTGEQFRQIVAGDVLHHAPAGLEDFAASRDRAHAEREIARRAGLDPPRPGEIDRERAAERRGTRRTAEQADRDRAARRRAPGSCPRAASRFRQAACLREPRAPVPPARRASRRRSRRHRACGRSAPRGRCRACCRGPRAQASCRRRARH